MTRYLPALRWIAVLLAIAIVGVQATAWWRARSPSSVDFGSALVGAPFSLVDQTGQRVTDIDLRGRAAVLVFGWTRDTDVTPALLQLLVAALADLGPKDEAPAAVFISVDPDRDGPAELKTITERYGGRIITLRGDRDTIKALTRSYRFPVSRITDALLPGGYILDHPAVYYVLSRDGSFRGAITYTTSVQELAGELRKLAK